MPPTATTVSTDAPTTPAAARTARASGALLVLGFVLLSLNTRVAFGQIGPLAPVAGWGPGTVTVLALIPPLCMGLFAPLGALARRRIGEERGLFWASVLLVLGAVLRTAGLPGLYAGTALVGAAVAVVNVLIPVFVRARFAPRRIGTMMGVYALSMGAGSAVVAALVAPVAGAWSWQAAIALAVVPAVLAAAGMAPQLRVERRADVAPGPSPRRPVGRTALAWSLTAYFGIQTLVFYATLAWLPTILVDAGLSRTTAGTDQAVMILGLAVGGFLAPTLAAARRDQRPHILGVVAICVLGLLGVLLAPASGAPVWAGVLGIGMGGGQALAGVLFTRRGTDQDHVAALSTMAQTGGYLISATGPALFAALHTGTGSWTAPLLTMVGLLLAGSVLSLRAGHDVTLPRRDPSGK
ncbi:MFS transporter [Kitasatospora sp. SUK 42]|uniref:MFS transporter n=1 Tax=Kitasatospora sp. SUK 42 TaxID=1588882 RepID=UPI001C31503B|nr:MFS transporter [Kitasatospora sp. SUK 42]MBV2155605.1 MFS transporter [Kitasatospora sp. SUK 42]